MRVTLLAAVIVVTDQLTKYWAVTRLKRLEGHSLTVVSGLFNLSYVENPGAAWGMLAGKQLFLIAFSAATLAFLVWKRRQLFDGLWAGPVCLGLIAGGVVGNLIDRVRVKFVIDFLDFHWRGAHFPAFNVADACICCGVFLFVGTQWYHDSKRNRSDARP